MNNAAKTVRLDKMLAMENFGSRKEVAKLIRKGFVQVDGEVVTKTDTKIAVGKNEVTVDGVVVDYREHVYIMMNKPAGVVSATQDNHDMTVLDILHIEMYRKNIFPAGRLDKDTTGFVVLTDDGELAHKMLSPKNHIVKTYEAELERGITEKDIAAFEGGISYAGEDYLPAKLYFKESENSGLAVVEISEGKFHQVKNMFAACDNKVIALKRVKIGGLTLDENLPEGEARYMTDEEKEKLLYKSDKCNLY